MKCGDDFQLGLAKPRQCQARAKFKQVARRSHCAIHEQPPRAATDVWSCPNPLRPPPKQLPVGSSWSHKRRKRGSIVRSGHQPGARWTLSSLRAAPPVPSLGAAALAQWSPQRLLGLRRCRGIRGHSLLSRSSTHRFAQAGSGSLALPLLHGGGRRRAHRWISCAKPSCCPSCATRAS